MEREREYQMAAVDPRMVRNPWISHVTSLPIEPHKVPAGIGMVETACVKDWKISARLNPNIIRLYVVLSFNSDL